MQNKKTHAVCLYVCLSVWIKVITALSYSKSCPRSEPPYPILNLVLQTQPDDQDDQDDQDHQYNQDYQDYQDDQDKDNNLEGDKSKK